MEIYEDFVDRLRVAEELNRYSEIISTCTANLSAEEQILLEKAFTGQVNILKDAYRRLCEIEGRNQYRASSIEFYRELMKTEGKDLAGSVINLIDQARTKSESKSRKVSLLTFKASIYVATHEFQNHGVHSKIRNLFNKAQNLAFSSLPALDPSRLQLAQKMTEFYKAVDPERACAIVHQAIEAAQEDMMVEHLLRMELSFS